jgi:tRNA(Ile)-lysidine synthase
MLSEGDCVLIGLSGGADSVCLTIVLDSVKKDFSLSIKAVYIDHGLRPEETGKEKTFCKNFCGNLKIPLYLQSVPVKEYARERKLNLQEAARELRLGVFDHLSSELGATKIALGHTADDQAETFLMRIVRGAGEKGLSGIPPVRGGIIRPLIEVERKDIERFLADNSSLIPGYASRPFMVDSSNLKKDYFRNWIRTAIIPELKKKNPSLIKTICRTSDILREEDTYLERLTTKTLMKIISRKDDETAELFLVPLERLEKPFLRRVLRRVIDVTKGLRGVDFNHIEDMIYLIKNGKAGDRINLPKGVRVIKEYSLVRITSKFPGKMAEYEINPPGEIIIKEADAVMKARIEKEKRDPGDGRISVLLDASKMRFPLKVRARADGDFFFPAGFGKRKKLQDFFVDEKIPRDDREKIPIVVSGNDIIWIAGYRADSRYMVTGKTEKCLRLIISKIKPR